MGNFFSAKTKQSTLIVLHSTDEWKARFESSRNSNKLMVIDFSASWCLPCQHMEPILKDLSTKHDDVEFVKIDVEELLDVASEFSVDAMPTFVFVKKGTEIDRLVGANEGELKEKILKHKG